MYFNLSNCLYYPYHKPNETLNGSTMMSNFLRLNQIHCNQGHMFSSLIIYNLYRYLVLQYDRQCGIIVLPIYPITKTIKHLYVNISREYLWREGI